MPLTLKTEYRNGIVYVDVDNKNLVISPQAWIDFNASYSKEEIKNAISDIIEINEIPVPKDLITPEDVQEDFKNLAALNSKQLLKRGDTYTRYDYDWHTSKIYIDSCNIGNKSSNYYHQDARYLCDSINSPSPHRSWYIKKFRDTLLNCLWTLKFDHIDLKVLKSGLHLRKYVASQFRPSAAKCVYEIFDSKDVLDFSMGWGDRLNGFLSCANTNSYFGIDPNQSLHDGYRRQTQDVGYGQHVTLHADGAENVDIPENVFDTVFTSPPYFNIERYTQEDNQSWKKFKKLDDWLYGFLYPVLEKSWKGLKRKGVMIINISDVYSNHRINQICDPMNDFLSQMPYARDVGTIGLRMAKRPNSKAVKSEGVFVEPMWVWKKD